MLRTVTTMHRKLERPIQDFTSLVVAQYLDHETQKHQNMSRPLEEQEERLGA